MTGLKNLTIGVELEFTGLKKKTAATIVAEHFGKTAHGNSATDNAGRIWEIKSDGSVMEENGGDCCEMVTPILGWSDIETLQEIIRKLRRAGAKVNETCGLHIHIGAQGMTAKAIRNLVNNVASHEELLYKALGVHEHRKRYCRPTDERFLRELNEKKPATLEEIGKIWYNQDSENFPTFHYHASRYTICNLHALFSKGTVEFRIFNGTLHAGEVKTAIQLACALVANAKAAKRTLYRPIETDNEKFAMRTWLTRPNGGMNLNGEEFSTLRYHLTKRLDGNTAWRFAV